MAATPTSQQKWEPLDGRDILQIGPPGNAAASVLGGIDSTGTPYGNLAVATTLPATVTAAAATISGATNTNSLVVTTTAAVSGALSANSLVVTTTATAAVLKGTNLVATGASLTVTAGQVGFSATVQSTVGAAGAAAALPTSAATYMVINVAGTDYVCPLFAKA